MKRIFFRSLFFTSTFLLSACSTFSPHLLGISDTKWASLGETKQKELHALYEKNYNQFHKSSNKSSIIPIPKNQFKDISVPNIPLTIKIQDGQVTMPPFTDWYAYRPVGINIALNTCNDILLQQINNPKQQISLTICYKNGILFLDPSHYDTTKMPGSLTFHYSPLWENGFTYKNINTTGYVQFKNATVIISHAVVK